MWSNFVIDWDPEINISAKITSSKQLVLTKTTYENFLKTLEAKFFKSSYKQLALKNWKKF